MKIYVALQKFRKLQLLVAVQSGTINFGQLCNPGTTALSAGSYIRVITSWGAFPDFSAALLNNDIARQNANRMLISLSEQEAVVLNAVPGRQTQVEK
jgi:hypothetical protein